VADGLATLERQGEAEVGYAREMAGGVRGKFGPVE
jgi:hypothetical protein